MELLTLLEEIRTDYLLRYEAVVEDRATLAEETLLEVTFRIESDLYGNLYTVDLLGRTSAGDQPIELSADPNPQLAWGTYHYRSMSVDVRPASWDAVDVTTSPPFVPDETFELWFERWMNVEGKRVSNHPSLSEVIHSASFSEEAMIIDLGSSPPIAMMELLDQFAAQGIRTVTIADARAM